MAAHTRVSTVNIRPGDRTTRRVAEQPGDGRAIERRRHDEEAQVVAQLRLRVEHQREPEVGLQTALVEFVEDHAARPLERRVALQLPREDAFGHDFDAGPRADARVGARAVADRVAGGLAERASPCARRPRARRRAAARASRSVAPRASRPRAARAARPCSCRRRAAPRARPRGAWRAPPAVPATRPGWAGPGVARRSRTTVYRLTAGG